MDNGTKITLAFLGGAIAGAAALALLNRNRLDLTSLRPLAADLVGKGLELKDTVLAKVDAMKEELEELAREASKRRDCTKAPSEPHPPAEEI